MRILIVDDDHFTLLAMARPLRKADYEVVEAKRAEQVMTAAEHEEFTIAVIDIIMPGMGGIEAIQRIHAGSPECKIYAVTSGMGDLSAKDTIKAAVKIGAEGGFEKPVNIDALLDTIRKIGPPTEKTAS